VATEATINGQGSWLQFSVMLPQHLDQVLAIELKMENDFAFYLVALQGEKVVGYGGMWIVLDEAHITNVAVHPELRGRGVGRALMMELLSRAVVLGAPGITLEVRVSNQVARNLYKSLGFVEKGMRRKYYSDNNEDAIIMWLYLRGKN